MTTHKPHIILVEDEQQIHFGSITLEQIAVSRIPANQKANFAKLRIGYCDSTPVTKQNGSLFLKVVNFDRSFLGRIGEPARDALLHLRH